MSVILEETRAGYLLLVESWTVLEEQPEKLLNVSPQTKVAEYEGYTVGRR